MFIFVQQLINITMNFFENYIFYSEFVDKKTVLVKI